jgi:uncharacterized membrane protein
MSLLLILTAGPIFGSTPVSLKVQEVLQKPDNPLDTGTAKVVMRVMDGPHAGKTFTYTHHIWGNPHYDPDFRDGSVFVGSISVKNGTIQRLELGQQRKHYTLLFLFLALTVVLIGLAGWEGFAGLFCSLLTLFLVIYGFFPLALNAVGILWSGLVLCVLTILITVPLVLKASRPTIPAIGSLITVTLGLFLFTGWGLDYLYLEPAGARHSRLILTHLNRIIPTGARALRPILITGIVLGTLGAMMDVSVVICSTVNEITRDTESISFMEAIKSGMTVGREILSTMVNTLIFAYSSILLPVLLAFHVFNLSWIRFLNYSFVGIEILRISVGLLGLSLIIPTSAIAAAWWSR